MTNLAIKGHKTRGKEVIEILKMLGGVNQFNLDGNTNAWYVLDENRTIRWCEWIFKEKGFTLEEFFEKFPYKVGDRVRVPEYESEVCISKMYWDGSEVQYEVVTDEVEWYSAKELNEFNEPKEETINEMLAPVRKIGSDEILYYVDKNNGDIKENKEKKINQMSLANCDLDEVEIVLGDKFELKIEDGKYYAVKKKLQYPKDFKECCDALSLGEDGKLYTKGYKASLIQDFHKLIICRNAYWKIAGEQMGLGKPWKPEKAEIVHAIFYDFYNDEIDVSVFNLYDNVVLCFPTEEMRDTFLKNFGHLIELCKELL